MASLVRHFLNSIRMVNKVLKIAAIIALILGGVFLGSFIRSHGESSEPSIAEHDAKSDQQGDVLPETDSAPLLGGLTGPSYSVVAVVDGDTLDVSIDGKVERLRMIGINTPETVDPRKPVECFGKEASNKAKELLSDQVVRLEADPSQGERDKYSRLLRYVFLADGRSFNQLMISEGYAYEYTYDTAYEYQSEFKQAQKDAEAAKRGLWADNACETPLPPSQAKPNILPLDDYLKQQPQVSGGDKDCADFSTHDEAQAYFEAGGGSPSYNFNQLDRDRDGIACESLP
jgi:micrococcal nuclease